MARYQKIKDEEIAKLSQTDKQAIYDGAMHLASGFLAHPSTLGSAATLNGRLALLEAEYPWLISLSARMAKAAHLLENDSVSLESEDADTSDIIDIPSGEYYMYSGSSSISKKVIVVKETETIDEQEVETVRIKYSSDDKNVKDGSYRLKVEKSDNSGYKINVTNSIITSCEVVQF